jgi:hypothetical protein
MDVSSGASGQEHERLLCRYSPLGVHPAPFPPLQSRKPPVALPTTTAARAGWNKARRTSRAGVRLCFYGRHFLLGLRKSPTKYSCCLIFIHVNIVITCHWSRFTNVCVIRRGCGLSSF